MPTARDRRHPPRLAAALLLAVAALLAAAGCGGERAPRDEPPALVVPAEPAEALAWVRAAQLMPEEELRKRLAAWPFDPGPFFGAEETQVAVTWRLRFALQDGDVEAAMAERGRLRARFEGHGVTPEGRGLTPRMIRGGIFEEALLQTRLRLSGAHPDAEAARAALEVAETLAGEADGLTGDEARRLEAVRFHAGLRDLDDLAQGAGLATGAGGHAWVLALTDDFALGEEPFVGPLERWQRDGADGGLRVVVVPRLTGKVRAGIRRVPVGSADEERAAMRERLGPRGLALLDDLEDPPLRAREDGTRDPEAGPRLGRALGLDPDHTAVFVVDARGRLVGRMDGVGLDLRALDPVVERLISR